LEGTKEFLRECRRDPGKSAWRTTSQFKPNFVTIAEGDYVIQYGQRVGTCVERDLHDGAQQHLVLLGLKLSLAERQLVKDRDIAAETLKELRSDLDRALEELRDLAHGIYPSQLETEGLAGALRAAAARAAIPTTLDCDGIHRYRPDLEAAVYFCCLEALQNAGKHAGANANATIRLREEAGTITFQVSDNGVGFESSTAQASAGIQNMKDRIGALDGDVTIHSEPGAGTSVTGRVPFRC
jgi:signal transduction histidine kinase